MDLHDAYEAVAREIEETAAKYAAGEAIFPRVHSADWIANKFEKARAEIARAVEEASRS